MAIQEFLLGGVYQGSHFAYQYYFLQEHIALILFIAVCKFL